MPVSRMNSLKSLAMNFGGDELRRDLRDHMVLLGELGLQFLAGVVKAAARFSNSRRCHW
jgi:hypothetical protein